MTGQTFQVIGEPLYYKYRTFLDKDDHLRILRDKQLYFAPPPKLNDPLDCHIPLNSILQYLIETYPKEPVRNMLAGLQRLKNTNIETGEDELLIDSLTELPRRTGVLSFCRNPNDPLLWSHYGDQHRGFALGFNPQFFVDQVTRHEETGLIGLSAVRYRPRPPFERLLVYHAKRLLRLAKKHDDQTLEKKILPVFKEQFRQSLLIANLSTKFKPWEYEQEHRVVRKKPGAVDFPPEVLVTVVFGVRTDDKHKEEIYKLLSGPEWKHVRKETARYVPTRFELEIVAA